MSFHQLYSLLFIFSCTIFHSSLNTISPKSHASLKLVELNPCFHTPPVDKKKSTRKARKKKQKRLKNKGKYKVSQKELNEKNRRIIRFALSSFLLAGLIALIILGFIFSNPIMWIIGISLAAITTFVLICFILGLYDASYGLSLAVILVYTSLLLITCIALIVFGLQTGLFPLWVLALIIGIISFLILLFCALNLLFNLGVMW